MKKIVALTLVLALAFSLAACGGGDTKQPDAPSAEPTPAAQQPAAQGNTDPAPAPEGGEKTYAVIVKSTGNPYNDREAAGFEEACKELGITCIIKAPANPTAEDQIAMIEELIAQEVSGIAIAANDPDALQNALKKAMSAGIAVVAVDSATNAESRQTFANQADTVQIGKTLVEAAYDMCGGEGQFAILSATAQATNQNAWIEQMQIALEDPKYANLELVKIAYGDDLRDKSVSETEGLIQTYPDLKCIVAPTTVGIAAAAKVVTDQGLSDKLKVTGLGLPSEMAEYIESGVCPYMYLWNPIDLGYLTGYIVDAIATGKITGAVGDSFSASRLGDYAVVAAADGGTEVLLGPPFAFTPENINDWKSVY
ncbi:rhamnose ABC transporter substrate-binding protein [Christensenellaceae bacterium OttesenSCG-928-M15]|nr:rhamnose ABC transporter substrate-binding protein [Christensenellaceae bacterium OttesenSCG-928-M15]